MQTQTETRAALVDKLTGILDKSVEERRDLNEAEETEWLSTRKAIKMLDQTPTQQPDPATLRLADGPTVITKQRSYSVLKAIGMSLSDPNVGDIGLEREMHQHLSRGKSPKGVMVPLNAIFTKTGQNTLTATTGGVLANSDRLLTDLLTDVDSAVRLATILGPLNVSTIAVPSDQKVRIPRKTGPGVAAFVDRDGDADVQDLTFDDISSTPHTLATGARLNRSSLIYSVPAMEGIVRNDLGIAVADAINDKYLHGSQAAASSNRTASSKSLPVRDGTSPANSTRPRRSRSS